jgi:transglycosylase-like protein/LysM domain-containing protein
MSRLSGQRAKTTAGYDARHAKPGAPGPAALIGTAAKAVPVTLVAGAASSALALSGTASAATVVPAGLAGPGLVSSGAADVAAVKTAAPHVMTSRAHHAGHRSAYTVVSGDTLSRISARFCGTPGDYLSLAGASGITNPNLIFPGQTIKIKCHAAPLQLPAGSGAHRASASHAEHGAPGRHARPGRHTRPAAPPTGTVSTAGMAAFEACVISRESGGNPRAVNPASGAGGLYQFLPSTWASLGFADAYPGGAQTAPVSVQRAAFARLYAEAGTSPWAPYDGC